MRAAGLYHVIIAEELHPGNRINQSVRYNNHDALLAIEDRLVGSTCTEHFKEGDVMMRYGILEATSGNAGPRCCQLWDSTRGRHDTSVAACRASALCDTLSPALDIEAPFIR